MIEQMSLQFDNLSTTLTEISSAIHNDEKNLATIQLQKQIKS